MYLAILFYFLKHDLKMSANTSDKIVGLSVSLALILNEYLNTQKKPTVDSKTELQETNCSVIKRKRGETQV